MFKADEITHPSFLVLSNLVNSAKILSIAILLILEKMGYNLYHIKSIVLIQRRLKVMIEIGERRKSYERSKLYFL